MTDSSTTAEERALAQASGALASGRCPHPAMGSVSFNVATGRRTLSTHARRCSLLLPVVLSPTGTG